ncbi:hypothetical protein EV356DRAFT_508005 [Viridothelium virens]|uniref:Uncharacterized protein n=1 Tax=Viridothelium virens TaxID=1048519 RepID=A0A6A6GYR2_VIRVR|nr:hypothetical protein EV356DRAFT_508005 [Viridothelium virens]
MASENRTQDHRYLQPARISTIESWQRTVPPRSPTFRNTSTQPRQSNTVPSRDREAVQAYLELKRSMMAKRTSTFS